MDDKVVTDPEFPTLAGRMRISVDGQALLSAQPRVYLALNKPRGLVTTTRDEQGRETVYACLRDAGLPWLAPVGRLDKASEGLLLFSNDPAWAAGVTGPDAGLCKTYHVQVEGVPDQALLAALVAGCEDHGQWLRAVAARVLRSGGRTAWLEIVLDEGRNRHIRRLLEAHGLPVLRLVRVAIGPVVLGELAKGGWRWLSAAEVAALAALPAGTPHG